MLVITATSFVQVIEGIQTIMLMDLDTANGQSGGR